MDGQPDDRLAAVARRQHGAFSRRQAIDCGFTRRMIGQRLTLGRWLRLDEGTYALPSHPFTWERQAMAATLATEPSMLSGRSAAALYELDGFKRGSLEVTVPSTCKARTKLALVRRSDFSQVTRRRGIPVLTVAYTIISLAGRAPRLVLESAVDDALVRRLVGLDELQDRFASWAPRRRPGVGDLRDILRRRDDGFALPTSKLERRLRWFLDDPSLPKFTYEHHLPWWSPGAGRVDAYCPERSLIVEADGRAWHTREREFRTDRNRDNVATANGHATLRFTWIDLVNYPTENRELVRQTVASRPFVPTEAPLSTATVRTEALDSRRRASDAISAGSGAHR